MKDGMEIWNCMKNHIIDYIDGYHIRGFFIILTGGDTSYKLTAPIINNPA
jgi:hypothetical protein